MNTDKAEIAGQPVPAANNSGVTSGVRDGDSQGPDMALVDPSMSEAMTGQTSDPVQNDGDDDIEPETEDDEDFADIE